MLMHPGVLALLLGSTAITLILAGSAHQGLRIIRHWDLASGSEQQLDLERRTALISLAMSYALAFQVASLFLFIYTADTLSPMFIGAMCAAGSLKVNGFGYPTLVVKVAGCLLAGVWLIINGVDNRAPDYPLIRNKYRLLLFIAPVLLVEALLQGLYLLRLQPNIITSCCGLLFSADTNPVFAGLFALPLKSAEIAFFASTMAVVALGAVVAWAGKGAILFAAASLAHLLISLLAVISFVSIYIYELPTHHCPFCLLQAEYGFIGYPLYGAMLVAAVCGLGAGAIAPFGAIPSLRAIVPARQRKLVLIALCGVLVTALVAGYSLLASNLTMGAY